MVVSRNNWVLDKRANLAIIHYPSNSKVEQDFCKVEMTRHAGGVKWRA